MKIALFVFFKKIVVTGRENIPENGPAILVANHPNTLMDPLIIATLSHQRIGFIANAGIFASKTLAAILRYFHVIPIFRKQDIAKGEKPDNRAAFSSCYEYLDHGGTFLIFPEGSSHYELKLREIKTGTARIALGYEELSGFDSSLQIIPFSLDYSDSVQFRSMIAVTIDKPISPGEFQNEYLSDKVAGVQLLTDKIRKSLASHVPQTVDKDQEAYLINAHRFYTTFCEPSANLYVNPQESLTVRKNLSNALNQLEKQDKLLYSNIHRNIDSFYSTLKSTGTTAGFYTHEFSKKSLVWIYIGYFFSFLLLLPFYLFGLATNYLPYIIPSKLFDLLKLEIEYKTPVALIAGLIAFPIFYGIDVWLFRTYISSDLWLTLLFLTCLPITGYIAMFYRTTIKRFVRLIRFTFRVGKEMKFSLFQLRDEIIEQIEIARNRI
ncbi:MAG: 1-acyl-sn-glycerol-3-phosphate acyltransferase [Cyclobacteriaceae bacterium]